MALWIAVQKLYKCPIKLYLEAATRSQGEIEETVSPGSWRVTLCCT